jgi:ComF family protein
VTIFLRVSTQHYSYMYFLRLMFSSLRKTAHWFLAPLHCASCKIMMEHEAPLCETCFAKIRRLVPTQLPLTATKQMTVYALGAYEEALAQLVRAKQYRSIAAARQSGVLLAQFVAEWQLPWDCIVAVPLHWRRSALRGYNQAEVIAREVAQAKQLPLFSIIKRKKYTAYQMSCSADGRKTNVQDAFVLKQSTASYEGKHILIIDDLMTTGATLSAVGRALLPLKPASISALVVAKVV